MNAINQKFVEENQFFKEENQRLKKKIEDMNFLQTEESVKYNSLHRKGLLIKENDFPKVAQLINHYIVNPKTSSTNMNIV